MIMMQPSVARFQGHVQTRHGAQERCLIQPAPVVLITGLTIRPSTMRTV